MYALVKTGGKQYRVAKDDTILVERIAAEEGDQVVLDNIIMLGDGDKVTIGTPTVEGAGVSATVMRQTRGPKIIIFRRKRRKNHRRTQGHRQDLTLLKITDIAEDAKKLAAPKKAAAPKAAPKKAAAPKAEATHQRQHRRKLPRQRLKQHQRKQRQKRPPQRKQRHQPRKQHRKRPPLKRNKV
jgi:large subunit ribosomal protein L21